MENLKTAGAPITLDEAMAWTANYRATLTSTDETRAIAFSRDAINEILNQENCAGVRIYYAIDDTGAKKMVLVGYDKSDSDIATGVIMDYGKPCPAACDGASPLSMPRP